MREHPTRNHDVTEVRIDNGSEYHRTLNYVTIPGRTPAVAGLGHASKFLFKFELIRLTASTYLV